MGLKYLRMLIMHRNKILLLILTACLLSCFEDNQNQKLVSLKKKQTVEEKYIKVEIFGINYFINNEKISETKKKINIKYDNMSNSTEKGYRKDSIFYWNPLIETLSDMPKYAHSLPTLYLAYDKDSILRKVEVEYSILNEDIKENRSNVIKEINSLIPITKNIKFNNTKSNNVFFKAELSPNINSVDSCCYRLIFRNN